MRECKKSPIIFACILLAFILGTNILSVMDLGVKAASPVSAQIYGIVKHGSSSAGYLSFGSGNIVTAEGTEGEEKVLTAVAPIDFASNASATLYLFVTNNGSNCVVPKASVTVTNYSVSQSMTPYYFDASESGHVKPATTAQSSTAEQTVTAVNSSISGGKCYTYQGTDKLDVGDTYCAKISLTASGNRALTGVYITLGFIGDINYNDATNGILSVRQTQNISSPAWERLGLSNTAPYNTNTPTKINTNDLSAIKGYLQNGTNGNSTQTLSDAYSESAPVYKDIDVVNVDIETGEIIGKLSDPNYKFEWFGGSVTLPANTTLASGRTLTAETTFPRVDCYTYYPTMYISRFTIANQQYISLSDKPFGTAVKVDGWYVGTFEAYYFNADNSLAWIEVDGVKSMIPRSYAYDVCPATSGSTSYFINNYGFTNPNSVTILGTDQTNQMKAASNLTKAWEAYATANPSLKSAYTFANGVQGENWKTYVYNLLLQIKYANNNLQSRVGNGNSSTYSPYFASGVTVTTYKNTTVTTGGNDNNTRYESERGGATIGVYNSGSKGTATYSQRGGQTRLSETGYNAGGMNYGYNSTYQHTNQYTNSEKQGLYMQQYLTYHKMEGGVLTDRYMVDGFVGSDAYTSVWCLGQANPWSNIYKGVFGSAVIWDCSDTNNKLGYLYVNFDNYDYANTATTWLMANNSKGFAVNDPDLRLNRGYSQMTYNLPTANGSYNYPGLSAAVDTGLQTLIGMQDKNSSANNGLGDYFYMSATESSVFGVLRGGRTGDGGNAGPFYFYVGNTFSNPNAAFGFRPMLF